MRVKILGICVTSLIMRVLLSGFWVSESQLLDPDTHIAQYLMNKRQPDNESWSVNRMYKIFFFKNYAENEAGKVVLDLFLVFFKVLIWKKASGLQLDFTLFR